MRKKIICSALIFSLAISVFTGCGTSAIESASGDLPGKITIALMPDENNPDAMTRNENFRKAMEERLGIKVDLMTATEYSVGIEAMRAGNLDVTVVSPMSYYHAKMHANIEPLVTTLAISTEPYKTVFIVKSDNENVNSLEDLRGTTFAFVDPASSSGYMYPKAKLIVDLGLDTNQLENPGYFFDTVTYSGKHDFSVMGVLMGDYEAAAVGLPVLAGLQDAGLIDMADIKIVGETDEIPNACFVVRADLPQSLKDSLLEFFLAYDDSEYFELLYKNPDMRYIRAYDSDYDVVYEMVGILGME